MKTLFVVPFRVGTPALFGTALLPDLAELVDGKIRKVIVQMLLVP